MTGREIVDLTVYPDVPSRLDLEAMLCCVPLGISSSSCYQQASTMGVDKVPYQRTSDEGMLDKVSSLHNEIQARSCLPSYFLRVNLARFLVLHSPKSLIKTKQACIVVFPCQCCSETFGDGGFSIMPVYEKRVSLRCC